eukprot:3571093-Prymnesium_polylepis.1
MAGAVFLAPSECDHLAMGTSPTEYAAYFAQTVEAAHAAEVDQVDAPAHSAPSPPPPLPAQSPLPQLPLVGQPAPPPSADGAARPYPSSPRAMPRRKLHTSDASRS